MRIQSLASIGEARIFKIQITRRGPRTRNITDAENIAYFINDHGDRQVEWLDDHWCHVADGDSQEFLQFKVYLKP